METFIMPGAFTLLLILLFVIGWNARRRKLTPTASVRAQALLEGNQRQLYRILRAGLPNHHVMARVPFSAFLAPRDDRQRRRPDLNAILADFIVCDSGFNVVAVVELTTNAHPGERDSLLRDAALPLVRWTPDALPDASEVRETIHDLESLHAMSERVAADAEHDDEPARSRRTKAASAARRREPRL
ncbi:DUF2726 domain-containing protein [Aquisalimonas asiatica]|uniref:DUF2726 domain-containing protein n=1 Tax=Aquisalimonas asiatica TaxID=406100 RepID=A0A1H8TLQ9_9GAMM|nr:DUF2726 domain-containing protein [Aquisalimonas asiatica]SEO91797.1 Protein of unknown function [Aquisalimonas asiatica]